MYNIHVYILAAEGGKIRWSVKANSQNLPLNWEHSALLNRINDWMSRAVCSNRKNLVIAGVPNLCWWGSRLDEAQPSEIATTCSQQPFAHMTAQHSTFDPNQCLALGRCEKWFQPIRTWNRASAQHSGLGSRVGGEAGGWWGQGEGRGSALKTCFTHHHCPSLRGELFHRIFNSFSSNPGFSVERFYTSWIIPGRGPSPGHDFRLHVLPDHGCS